MRYAALVLLFASACNLREPHALVEIRDPQGIAGGATSLVLFDPQTPDRIVRQLDGRKFDVTVTVASPREGPRTLVAEALADGSVVARGQTIVPFAAGGAATAQIDLYAPCTAHDECAKYGTDQVRALCHDARCVLSTCGDGIVEARNEDCEDGNANPNDACHQCRNTRWRVEPVVGFGESGGDPLRTVLDGPHALAIDRDDNLYVADGRGDILRLDRQAGLLVRFARSDLDLGSSASSGFRGLDRVVAMDVDGLGHVFVVDGHRLHRFDARTGELQRVAGTGVPGFSGDDGPGPAAQLDDPRDVAVDGAGNVFIADTNNGAIRRVDAITGHITTFVQDLDEPRAIVVHDINQVVVVTRHDVLEFSTDGSEFGPRGWNGTNRLLDPADVPQGGLPREPKVAVIDGDVLVGGDQSLWRISRVDRSIVQVVGPGPTGDVHNGADQQVLADGPDGLVVTSSGTIVFSERRSHRVREIRSGEVVRMVAGAGRAARPGDGDLATAVDIDATGRIATAPNGVLYFAEIMPHQRVLRANGGRIDLIAGLVGAAKSSGDGGPADEAQLDQPDAIAIVGDTLYVGEAGRVRRVDLNSGVIETFRRDVATPAGMDAGPDGTLYIADTDNDAVIRIATDGTTSTVAVERPSDVAVDSRGRVYIAQPERHIVSRVDAQTGRVERFAGLGRPGRAIEGASAVDAPLDTPTAVAADSAGNIYICDSANDRVIAVDASGLVRVVVGGGQGVIDGTHPRGFFIERPRDVHVGAAGELFVASLGRVYRADDQRVEMVVGDRDPAGDGPLAVASLGKPVAVTAAKDGAWLVADAQYGRIRRVDPTQGLLTTVAGLASGLTDDGTPPERFRLFEQPAGIARDPVTGAFYVAEGAVGTVLRVDSVRGVERIAGSIGSPEGGSVPPMETYLGSPAGLALSADGKTLYIADPPQHVIRSLELVSTSAPLGVAAGRYGERGSFGPLLNAPEAVAVGRDGALYVADTQNNRVLRVVDGRTDVVLGDGSAASSGNGRPARAFAVNAPVGLAVDVYGNLFVTSRTTVRRVSAGADSVATGDDEVATIYGADRSRFPQSQTVCLSGLTIDDDSAGTLVVTDRCQGFLLKLVRGSN